MSKKLDLTGQRFGRLICIEYVKSNKVGHALWLCKCDCGNEIIIMGYQVKNGNTKSCGCLKSETTIKRNFVHGLCMNEKGKKTRLYGVWRRMRQRCEDPNSTDSKWYYDRYITVCKEWLDYKTFHEWAISHGYKKGLTIERISNNGNYSPDNCKWIPAAQQARNKRNNHFIVYKGKRKTLAEWSEILGIESSLLRYRLKHWNIEEAFNRSIAKGGKRGDYEDKTTIIEEFCKRQRDKHRV